MVDKNKFDIRSRSGIGEPVHEYRVGGKAICFGERTLIGGEFYEIILPNAISYDTLKDVCLIVNHDNQMIPLARTRNGSLELTIKEDGVYFEAMLNPNMNVAGDLYEAIDSGLIDSCSFAFCDVDEEWDFKGKVPTRTIKKIRYIPEISIVVVPAYNGTSVSTRTAESLENARREVLKAEIRAKLRKEK